MAHAVVWKYEDTDGDTKVLIGHPGAFAEDADKAVEDGRKTMSELEGYTLTPVSVVETDVDVDDDIYGCEEIYLGPDGEDLLFYDISGMGRWERHSWWPL